MNVRPIHRRCRGCRKVVRLNGPPKNQTGLIYTRSAMNGRSDAAGVERVVFCWDCYDISRGNTPRSLQGEELRNFQFDQYVIERNAKRDAL